ncbi:MAG: HypC/HybG/HupF family hydrogenase formation chaperone [Acidimicrobiales bacterium]
MTFDPVVDRGRRRTLPEERSLPMCMTCPAQVLAIDAQGATIDTEGRRRRASMVIVPDVAVGDWVLVGMGTILERLDPDVAREMRDALRGAAVVRDA